MQGVETTRFNYQAPTKSDPAWALQQELSQNAAQWQGRSPAWQHHPLALNPGLQLLLEAERSLFYVFLFLFKQRGGTAGHPTAGTLLMPRTILAAFQMGNVHIDFLSPTSQTLLPNSPKGRVGSSNVPGVCFSPPETHPWLLSEGDLSKTRDSAGSWAPWKHIWEGGRQEPTHPQPFHCRTSCPEPWRKMNSPGGPTCPDSNNL